MRTNLRMARDAIDTRQGAGDRHRLRHGGVVRTLFCLISQDRRTSETWLPVGVCEQRS